MKRSHDVEIQEEVDFSSLVQNKALLKGLTESGYEKPSPIQLEAIPMGRLGVDLIAQAKSGTGKTVVFGVIAIESIVAHIRAPQAILIAPTREIAVQIKDVVSNLGRFIQHFKCEVFIGGLSVQADLERLKNCQVVVGTPGRLMSLLDEEKINTTHIKLLVLDEADKLMSDVFKPQVEFIFNKLTQTKQCIAFSATFTDELLNSLFAFMKDPQTIRLTQGVPTLHEVQQYYVHVGAESTDTVSVYRAKFEAIANLLGKVPFYQCMVFVNSLPRSIELAKWLTESGWKSGYISAGISQEKRLVVMEEMRDFKIRILVCSDLIARGIDIDRVNFVVNLDFPWDVETYLHRIGRTGRYGTSGIAVNLIGPNDNAFLEGLQEQNINVLPLPDKVLHSEFLKELSENDKEVLQKHESEFTGVIKPIVYKKPKLHKKAKSNQLNRVKMRSHPSNTMSDFIPPDLFF